MDDILWFFSRNADTIFMATLILVLIGLVVGFMIWDRRASILKYLEHRRDIRVQRGIAMAKKKKVERLAYVKGLLADVITDGLEEAWFKGKITAEERDAMYRAIGKTHGIPDLLPHMSPAQLKSIIKGRRSRGIGPTAGPVQPQPAWDGIKPETTSDDQPPETGTNVINAKKRFGEKALKIKTA